MLRFILFASLIEDEANRCPNVNDFGRKKLVRVEGGCISTAKRSKAQGLDVAAILLPGAYHSFDNWGNRDAGVRDHNKGWSYGKCDLVGNEDGIVTDRL